MNRSQQQQQSTDIIHTVERAAQIERHMYMMMMMMMMMPMGHTTHTHIYTAEGERDTPKEGKEAKNKIPVNK